MSEHFQRVIIVGGSSGIGAAMARELGRRGASVAVLGRNEAGLRRVAADIQAAGGSAVVRVHDVRQIAEVPGCFQEVATALGGLDLVVYASGIMPDVGSEEYPTDKDIATIETNFSGAVAWLNQAAFRFARTGGGTIVGISSVAGDRGRPSNPVYNATKAALNSYLESLRNRVARHHVRVVTIKPGWVRTPMMGERQSSRYLPAISAERAASEILAAAEAGTRIAYIPGWWRYIMLVVRAIPSQVMERVGV
jgi:decaprenylphospho-beta-D-erythro-pentofuranosid-2-ulose 2-reductase